jgi:hypothetical protein
MEWEKKKKEFWNTDRIQDVAPCQKKKRNWTFEDCLAM